MVSETDMDIQDKFWKVRCQSIILSFWDVYWFILGMDARGQRALTRRNRREAVDKIFAAPREENLVESDTEESEILKEGEQVPLSIRIQVL